MVDAILWIGAIDIRAGACTVFDPILSDDLASGLEETGGALVGADSGTSGGGAVVVGGAVFLSTS